VSSTSGCPDLDRDIKLHLRISTPEPTVIRIDAISPTFPGSSFARDWISLLSYLIDACPNLYSLALKFQLDHTSLLLDCMNPSSFASVQSDACPDLESERKSLLGCLGSFPSEVFPHLRQYTGSLEVIFELDLFHREIVVGYLDGERC